MMANTATVSLGSLHGASFQWTAPELIFGGDDLSDTGRLTTQSDVYSFGCFCIEVGVTLLIIGVSLTQD